VAAMPGINHHQRAAGIGRAENRWQADLAPGGRKFDTDHIVLAAACPSEVAVELDETDQNRDRQQQQQNDKQAT
jgi:predicted NAD/FAD-dependent oxidoreductase